MKSLLEEFKRYIKIQKRLHSLDCLIERTTLKQFHAQEIQRTGYSSDNSATEMKSPRSQSNIIILIRCIRLHKTNSQNGGDYSLKGSSVHKFFQFCVFLRVIQHI